MPAVEPSTEALSRSVDAHIESFLATRREAIPEAVVLIDEIERVIRAGGKRLRPAFCYWGYRSAGGSHGDDILRLVTAFELLHTFAIVHDDIMDRSLERRGQPTTFAIMGADGALLVGDLALVLADAAFWGSGLPVDRLSAAFSDFTVMREQVIAGQHMDLAAQGSEITEDAARTVAILKSGSYSIEYPLLIGAELAGAPDDAVAALRAFGRPLGEAFQLVDDILGVFGDPAATGKPVDSDIREGKRNILFAKTVASLSGRDRDFFLSRWGAGAELSEDEVERLRVLVDRCGARAATQDLIEELAGAARRALAEAPIDAGSRPALEDLMRAAIARSH